ncbi:hypothetical protein M758_1G148100 [Ceratodon purpureus]|nr:hypothetical protein M758_1G148100 [Ceratodon purpureus]
MALPSGAGVTLYVLVLFMGAVGALGLQRNEFVSSEVEIDYKQYVSALVIFGDSTVDCGNNNYLTTVVKSNFQPYGRKFEAGVATGRFCDGKIAVDYLTERIGYPLGPPYLAPNAHGDAILSGINFASSASGWDDNTAKHFNVKGLTTQFSWFKNWKSEVVSLVGQEKGNYIVGKALYVISTGSNDWVNNYYINLELMNKYSTDTYTTFLIDLVGSYVKELYDSGGRNIVVLGLPPLGCLPSQISLHGKGKPGCVEEMNNVAVKFNQLLEAKFNSLKPNLHGGRLIYIDIFNPLFSYVNDAQQYGFNVTRTGCCGTGDLETAILCNMASVGTCKDAYSYVWWDSFHPTTHAYSLLADNLWNQAVPQILAPELP